MMKVLLLDSKEFEKINGKVFYRTNYHSFNMKKYVAKLWSNGWCPVSQFKVDTEGNVYGRIANELVPSGFYNNVVIETNESILMNKYKKEMSQATLLAL